jgi:lycopene beta-cyclase
MTPPFEIIIIGAGCAGLSLAMRLSSLLEKKRVLIVEARKEYANDRTWCFWGNDSAQLRHLVTHRWHSVSLQTQDRRVKVDCRTAPYEMISAETFYAAALQEISRNPCMELATGVALTSEPWKDGDLWRIETSAGQHAGRFLIDTRPRLPVQAGDAVLWQSFLGQEIECEVPAFDPPSASLMNFLPIENGRIPFIYVLPFSPQRALVEFTVFSPAPLGPDELTRDLHLGIAAQIGAANYSVRRTEHGILPMGLTNPAPAAQASSVRVGVTAGGARSSSGFAFQRIQRWAHACALSLSAGRGPVAHPPDSWSLRAMDNLFLRVLRARPEISPDLYLSLFGIKNPHRLIRFMSDQATLADCASVALSLPAWPFLAEIPNCMAGRAYKIAGGRSA